MKKAISIIALIAILSGLALAFYDINLVSPDPNYDITLFSRRNYNYGFGICYKKKFEIWRFNENIHGGCIEWRAFPK